MANYCANSIVFFSKDRSKLARLLRKVYAAYESSGPGFWNLLILHGYTNRQIAGLADKRDCFTYCDTKLNLDKEQIAKALSKANLRQDIRGEVLTLDEFIELSNIINQIQNGDEK